MNKRWRCQGVEEGETQAGEGRGDTRHTLPVRARPYTPHMARWEAYSLSDPTHKATIHLLCGRQPKRSFGRHVTESV